jgi:oligopeptide/dipeptide ABC transporter ATP-binding protein
VVETGPVGAVFDSPLHPYTLALRNASPIPEPGHTHLPRLTGDVPSAISPPTGCPFHPRCPNAGPVCSERFPDWVTTPDGKRGVACHFPNTVNDVAENSSVKELS